MIADFAFGVGDRVPDARWVWMVGWAIVLALCVVAFWIGRFSREGRNRRSVFVQPWKPMEMAEVARVMQQWTTDDPRWRATWDWLNEEYKLTLEEVNGNHSAEETQKWKGRLQMILHLRTQWNDWQSRR